MGATSTTDGVIDEEDEKKALSIVGRRMVGFNVPADLFKDKWNNNYIG